MNSTMLLAFTAPVGSGGVHPSRCFSTGRSAPAQVVIFGVMMPCGAPRRASTKSVMAMPSPLPRPPCSGRGANAISIRAHLPAVRGWRHRGVAFGNPSAVQEEVRLIQLLGVDIVEHDRIPGGLDHGVALNQPHVDVIEAGWAATVALE